MPQGLVYPPTFLDALHQIVPRPNKRPPVRAIDSESFVNLHARHLLAFADPALDAVLFPYLHGVEHGNDGLREYFCGPTPVSPSQPSPGPSKIAAPDYRGLIWVAADDEDNHYIDDGLDDEMLIDEDEINVRRPSDASTTSLDSSYSLLRNSLQRKSSSFSSSDRESSRSRSRTPPSSSPSLPDLDLPDDITMSDSTLLDSTPPSPTPETKQVPVYIPCSFKPSEILNATGSHLAPPRVPDSVSLRNFGIQVAAYARISDIVVYSPTGRVTRSILDLASRLAGAHEALYDERLASSTAPPIHYNTFILTAHPSSLPSHILTQIPHFSKLETVEMQSLTRSSEILSGVFLGNAGDVPAWSSHEASTDVFEWQGNNPMGYDLVVECLERGTSATVPNASHLKRAEEHLSALQSLWATGFTQGLPPARPPPNAHSILHLPFPCSPSTSSHSFSDLLSFISFIQSLLHPQGTRRSKILIYSNDGYTESSVLALALVMAEKKCALPAAYLELQIRRWRSFFVHKEDLGLLRKLEARYHGAGPQSDRFGSFGRAALGKSKERGERERTGSGWPWNGFGKHLHHSPSEANLKEQTSGGLSIKFGKRSTSSTTNSSPAAGAAVPAPLNSTTWFDHPKFDGSFPSRVLSFLYLGNLNHAVNANMLHALGITHVVSVGECAILPPEESSPVMGSPSVVPYGHGSLWLEEREGRIKVLDIKNMSDDGVDSLLPQLGPICDWIEQARINGGQVLVHCRVGVSRSATVTIAYLMKHLQLPLVDAYLIVRSRRLSVLIQPNMRLLFNLIGWEVQIAKESVAAVERGADVTMPNKSTRASDIALPLSRQEETAAKSLARCLSWPFLAREVHRLNAKYIR